MSKNRAVIARELGPPETFAVEAWNPGPPGPGEVSIRVHAAGVSFVDWLIAAGLYQAKPELPFIPGSEFAGVIEAVGQGVPPSRIGERVAVTGLGGALCDIANVPAVEAVTMPDTMPMEEAAVFRVSNETVYHALVQRARLAPGEIVCVLGASGAIGHAAIQIGKALGAVVIASASSEEKRMAALAFGADHAVDSNAPDWRAQVKQASGGHGINVVVDPLGDRFTEPAFRSLAWGGRHLMIGFAAGAIPKLPANLPLLKGAALVGVNIRDARKYEAAALEANEKALFALHAAGKLRPRISAVRPLEEFAAAMNDARNGASSGRIIIAMDR